MCGRYARSKLQSELLEEFKLTAGATGHTLPPDWNITPTREIYIIRENQNQQRELANVSWGLIAPWSKDRNQAQRSQSQAINARSESIHEKPTFRRAFKSKRCLIPATGYFEWATELGKFPSKQPFYIHAIDEAKTMLFAGIFDRWIDSNGEIFESCAIITREAVGILAKIHHRMPTFLPADRWDRWLDPKLNQIAEIRLLMELDDPAANLAARPVSTLVNMVRNNGPELLDELELGEPQTLF